MHSAETYRALVDRLTDLATREPGRYKLQLALLAAAGFAVLGGSLVLALALSAGLLALLAMGKGWALIKLAFIPLVFAWTILKSLWVRLAEPEGHRLRPGDAPALEALVEQLRVAARAPALSGIVVTPDFNAAAASVPRLLGLLGSRHFLVLGLPLMQRLDQRQFAAVLAHEFGHFGGGHSHFAGWIYRVRASWYRVCEGLQGQAGWLSRPMIRFFEWYAPYFNAYSFVLARQNEFQADAMSAQLVGGAAAAQALVISDLASKRLERDFWPAVNRAIVVEPQPPAALYQQMRKTLLDPSVDEATRLAEALREQPGLDDTHPVLAQRLQALGEAGELPAPPSGAMADALLGDLRESLAQKFSDDWRQWISSEWTDRYNQASARRERLSALESARAAQPWTPAEQSEHACLVAGLRHDVDPVPGLRHALEVDPGHAQARYLLGEALLDRQDASGVGELEQAIAADRDVEEAALRRLHAWAWSQGGRDAAEPYAERLRGVFERRGLAQQERSVLSPTDQFLGHGLDDAVLAAVGQAIDRLGGVAKLWIARKQLVHDTTTPHYVVLVQWRGMTREGPIRLRKLVDALPLDGSWLAVEAKALGRAKAAYRAAGGEPVYRKGWFGAARVQSARAG